MKPRALAGAAVCYGAAAAIAVFALTQYQPVRVVGGSMHPALRSGDLVFVRDREPQVRDIVLLKQPGHGPVLHRVVGKRAGKLVTRGDANPTQDRTFARREWVSGTVAVVVPAGRFIDKMTTATRLR